MTTSILYIPASGDPHGILADGLCGAKMPKVTHEDDCKTWYPYGGACPGGHWALPLVWRGDVVPEAEDRLQRRLFAATPIEGWEAQDRALDGDDAPTAVCEVDGGRRLWALAVEAARVLGGRVEVVSG